MKIRIVGVSAILAMVLAASLAVAQMPSAFSADMKMTNPKMGNTTGKIYFTGNKFRMEMNAAGHDSIMIADMPSKTMYMLMPQQHMYMEMRTDQMGAQRPTWKPYDASNPCANEPGVTCKRVGTEMVNGRLCDKWLFTGKDSSRTVWIDQKNHIPIKTVMGDTTWELTNIKEGAQSASLFQVPADYHKMDMGGMMQQHQHPH